MVHSKNVKNPILIIISKKVHWCWCKNWRKYSWIIARVQKRKLAPSCRLIVIISCQHWSCIWYNYLQLSVQTMVLIIDYRFYHKLWRTKTIKCIWFYASSTSPSPSRFPYLSVIHKNQVGTSTYIRLLDNLSEKKYICTYIIYSTSLFEIFRILFYVWWGTFPTIIRLISSLHCHYFLF